MSSKPLSVVVPVYNVADHVDHLFGELAKLADLDPQVIIVDDGSTDATVDRLRARRVPGGDLVIVESARNGGAGRARNIGFPRATGEYTLFFDADDDLHPEGIVETLGRLDATGADVSVNSYEFVRAGQATGTGMNVIDRVLWREYLGAFPDETFELPAAPRFLEFTNYPWNKILRTAHFQALDLALLFGETRVHNDVLGHWNILLNARRITLVDRVIVTHHISGGRDHLSNRFGRERLDLFVALRSVHALLRRNPDRLAMCTPVFWSFVKRLVTWAEAKLQDGVKAEFGQEARALASEVSFDELLGLTAAGDIATYRWVMNRIG